MPQIDFDTAGALKAGASPSQIADYLAEQTGFDISGARKAGASDDQIIAHLAGPVQAQQPATDQGNFSRGWDVGFGQLAPLAKGAVGLLGATGEQMFGKGGVSTAVKDWGIHGYQEGMQKLQPLQRDTDELTTAWDKAKQGNIGALVDWASYGLGYGAAQLAQAGATAAVGAVIGTAAAGPAGTVVGAAEGAIEGGAVRAAAQRMLTPLIAKEASKLAEAQAVKTLGEGAAADAIAAKTAELVGTEAVKRAAVANVAKSVGQTTGLMGYAGVQEAGSIYPEAEEEAKRKGAELTGADLARVWGSTALATALEGATDKLGLDALTGKVRLPGKGGLIARTAVGGAIGAAGEAGTEAAQTIAERYGAGQEVFSPEGVKDIVNSAGLGAIGGAPVGAFAGAFHGPAPAPAAPVVNPTDAALNQAVGSFEAARNVYLDPGVASDAVTSAPSIDEAINTATAIAAGGTQSLSQAVGARAMGAQLASAMDRQAELTAQANAAPTAFDRQNAVEQSQVALDALRPAQAPASNVVEDSFANEMQAKQRLAVLQDEASQAGQDPSLLSVQPSATAQGRFQIVAQPAPVSQAEATAAAPAPVSPAEVEQRLSAASNEGLTQAYLRQRDILDRGQVLGSQLSEDLLPGDQQAFRSAYENVANRGGVASPKEAAVLDRLSPNERLYDRVEGRPPALKAAELPTVLPTAQQSAVNEARNEGIARRMGMTEDSNVPGTVASPSLIVPEERAPARQRTPMAELNADIANTLRENANDASMTQLEQQAQARQAQQNAAIEAATPPAQQEAPAANRVIEAFKKIPALRTAEDKAVVDSALRTYAPEDIRILQSAATAPFSLTSTDRVRLGDLKQQNVKASEQRVGEAPVAEQPAPFTVADAKPTDVKTLPQQSQAQPGQMSAQSHRFLKSLASIFGKKLVVFESAHPQVVDGYVINGEPRTIYLNRNSQKSHLVVFGHELMHLLKMTEPAAYEAIRNVVKLRAEAEGRFKNEQGIKGDFEELISDLQGDLFSDTGFWGDVFREVAGKQGDKAVIRLGATLMRAVNRFVKALKSVATFDTSAMVENMGEVRSAIQTALATYAKNQKGEAQALYQEERNAANQESQQAGVPAERQAGNQSGPTAQAGGGNSVLSNAPVQAPEGEGRQGVRPPTKAEMAVRRARQEMGMRFSERRDGGIDNVEAYHFSTAPRRAVSTSAYGSNYAGSGKEQYLKAADERRRQRAYFYFDKGTGISPESGVGGYAHKATLNNVYDINKDPLKLGAATQAQTETNILDAGFSGYLDRMEGTQSGQVIMLGKQDIPVQALPLGTRVQSGAQYATPVAQAEWSTRATGTREQMEERVARMRSTVSWRGYDIRIVPDVNGAAVQVRPIAEPEIKASDKRALPGAPDIQGATGPDPALVAVAEQYARANGIALRRQSEYVDVDEDRARRIAAAYDAMPHAPQDPKVREAYANLIRQTRAQYDALIDAGYQFTFFDSKSDPYQGNPWNAMRDLRANKRMAVYGTYDGYGTEGVTQGAVEDNPMLADTGLSWSDQDGVQHPVTANDLFRAVHDAFGHGLEGAGFRARGEENAWQAHVRLFTGSAVAAITSETRGQNSWLNYGPYGLQNSNAKVENTVFADQKTGLMPSWTWTEGRAGDMVDEEEGAILASAKRPVRQEVADAADISRARQIATSQTWATNRDFKLALQQNLRNAARTVDLRQDTPEMRRYITRQILKEAREALVSNSNAVGWYDEKVTTALEVVSTIHPELKTDQQSRFAFIWALAVTSNGVKVNKNFELAERAYRQWKASDLDPAKRRMPTSGIGVGTAAGKIHEGLATYNDLSRRWGYERMRAFATTLQPNRDVKTAYGRAVSGEGMDTQVYGAGILGPKIGNGFFMNLFGEFGQLTMDRWWVRMWGRMTGDLVDVDQKKVKESRDAFLSIIDVIKADKAATRSVERALNARLSKAAPVEMAKAVIKATTSKDVRDTLAEILPATPEREAAMVSARGKVTDFVSVADELRKAAKSFYNNLDGQIEVPGGSRRRDMMREVSQSVLGELQKDHPHLTMADFQALMWYPEKTLYDSAGADNETSDSYEDDEAPDYANAAIALAREQGVPNADIDAAVERARSDIDSRQRARRSGRATGGVSPQDQAGAGGDTAPDAGQEIKASEKRSPLGFYSALATNVDQIKTNAAPAQGWKDAIKGLVNKGAVKADEVEWSGVNDWLDLQKGKVTKEQVAEYLRQGGVQVEETVLGRDGKPNNDVWEPDDGHIGNTRYGRYTLPGGENYREVLLTLPTQEAAQLWEVRQGDKSLGLYDDKQVADALASRRGGEVVETVGSKPAAEQYKSAHWDQPNVLAHLRLNDRTGADGKRVLLVEEIQSDWGQEGKKRGFNTGTPAPAGWADIGNAKSTGVIPSAPFVTKTEGWLNLALKRVITMAVQDGYDKVAFTTGEQNADRYDLSKQISSVLWERMSGDKYQIIAYGKNQDRLFNEYKLASELPDVVGKELADKIVNAPADKKRGSFMGLDLQVGGEGMRAFYDQIVPQAVKKLLPKVGGGQMQAVDIGGSSTQPGFDVTPAMQQKVQSEGLPLFSEQRNPQTDTPEFKRWFGDSKVVDENGEPLVVYHGTNGNFNKFKTNQGAGGELGAGAYFTPDRNAGSTYAEGPEIGTRQGANVMPVYLSLQNPFDATGKDTLPSRRALIDQGFDGVVDRTAGGGTQYVAFRPTQIKSATGNNGQFDPANPDIRYSQQRIVGDSGRAHTPEQMAMFKRVGRIIEVPTLKERIASLRKDLGKRITQGVVDQFAPIKDLTQDGYLLARLSKGAAGAIEAFLHHGKLSLNGGVYDADRSGGVIDRVFKPLQGEGEDFLWWVAGNRAERLSKEDRENLFTAQDIAAAKSLDNGTTKFDYVLQHGPNAGRTTRDRTLIYRDALKTFDEFNKNAMDMAEQSGLINKESRQYWEHEFYVPFYRVSDDQGGFVGGNIGKGLVRQQAFKQLKGGTDKLNSDLLANTLQNWSHLIDAAAKNRAAKATLEAAANLGIAVEAPQSTIQQMGKAGGKAVWFMDDGVQRHFLVDPDHSDLLAAINGLQFAGLRGPIMDVLSGFKHWLTLGVTASPFFKIRNLIRDSMQAIAVSPLGYNPVTNIKQGIAASNRESQTYVSSLASGGLIRFGTMLEGDASERVRQLVRMGVSQSTILNSPDKIQAVRNKFEKAFMAYSELGNRGEEINRAALYDQLIKSGVSHAEAALMARDLMDFSMQGSWASVRFLTQIVPFMNARLQGLYKLGKAAKEDKARFAAVLGAVGAFSLMLMSLYHDDDDWKKREDWDRDNYWWFKIGGTAYRIPKPFEIGALATLAERGVELFTDKQMTKERFLKRFLAIAGDNLSMNPIPQAVKPVLDIYANKDSFTGRPIETMGMDKLAPDYRFNARTSMVARGLGTAGQSVLNATGLSKAGVEFLSPVQIDHLIQGYFSWLGSFAVGGADMLVRPMTKEPTRPAADMFKLASGGMVSQLDSGSSRYVSDVYDQAKVLEQAYGTWHSLIKQGKLAEAREYLQDNRQEIARYKMVEKVKQGEAKFNEMIRMIERSNYTPDEKRERINRVRELQDRMARVLVPQ